MMAARLPAAGWLCPSGLGTTVHHRASVAFDLGDLSLVVKAGVGQHGGGQPKEAGIAATLGASWRRSPGSSVTRAATIKPLSVLTASCAL